MLGNYCPVRSSIDAHIHQLDEDEYYRDYLSDLTVAAEKDILADDDLVLELLSDQIWRDNESDEDQKALASAIKDLLKGDAKQLKFLLEIALERKADYMAGEQMADAA